MGCGSHDLGWARAISVSEMNRCSPELREGRKLVAEGARIDWPPRRLTHWKILPARIHRDRLSHMATELSPQIEQYLTSVVAGGLFPTQEAALEAAIAALREKTEPIPFVPPEHMELVEQGMASARAGRARELTDADWENLRQRAHAVAPNNPPSNR